MKKTKMTSIMTKMKWKSTCLLAFIMTLAILASSLVLNSFAITKSNGNPASTPTPTINAKMDSTFVLANSNVQTGDADYNLPSTGIVISKASNQSKNIKSDITDGCIADSQTVGDPMVYLTQKWLNQEYGNVTGFGSVMVDGLTGWDVVYGLLRALQHELGITQLANSFGPTTTTLYSQNLLHRQDGVTNRKFAILQAALWCKGYNPGYYLTENPTTGIVTFQEIFNINVENAVKQLKSDAGLVNPDGVVSVNVMKALMSMDSFKLLGSSYGGKAEVRTMQQKLNRNYEAYTGLNACDGVYGRNTNRAFIYAFQAEEGLPTGIANGSFGPTTKSLCPQIPYIIGTTAAKTYQGAYYTNTQISTFTEFLQFALFINGFGDGYFDGVFDYGTQQVINNFQQHYALPRIGKADLTTWLALLISSGDTTRTALAADCATILDAAKARTLYDNGYRYVGRYLTGTYGGGISKAMTPAEVNIILSTGLRFFPIFQQSANSVNYFTPQQGTSDAQSAIAAAVALGIPKDTIIYFAVDFDAMDYQITSNVIPYFSKVFEEMSNSIYRTGIYGARNVCSRVAKAGYSCSSFVGDMSTGFSGNLGFKIPDDWAFSQFANLEGTNALGTGDGRIEIDKDAFSGWDQGVSRLVTGIDPVKKAIYVLPGFMGSKLYKSDGTPFWIEGTDMDVSLLHLDNLPIVNDIAQNAIIRKSSIAMLNSDGSGSQLKVDASKDEFGALGTYELLMNELKNQFDQTYYIEFFPYNWLGDLNDSVIMLDQDIKKKGYSEIVFITHSTGGLLATAYIAKNNAKINEIKPHIKKAILVAAPLLGTYSSLMGLETGSGGFIGENYKLVDWIVQAAKSHPLLTGLTNTYSAATNWAKDVTHNSPTTYQLLPSIEYLKLMPQLHKDAFANGTPVTSIGEYYSILNGSTNINSNLTNGNNRSHQYFRETVLGNDIVKVLRSVDTTLIASKSTKDSTPTIAKYENKLFGGTRLKEMVFRPDGDSTIAYVSATANLNEDDGVKIITKSDINHTALIQDITQDGVIQDICNEIMGLSINTEGSIFPLATALSTDEEAGMSGMIKINYTSDTTVSASIYNAVQNEVAYISSNDIFGFDGGDFIYYSYADQPEKSDATIYLPNNGYKIVFKSGNTSGETVNFNAEISTLDINGWKDTSVTKSVLQTSANGTILSIDGTVNTIDNSNISNIVNGTVESHFTDWELPDIIKLNIGNVQSINIIGSEAAQVSPQLGWTSTNESIATVSQAGVVTAIGYGKTTITATDGNKSATCEITVMQNATMVNFPNVEMLIGERMVIAPVFAPVTATETAMTYTYEKASIVSIDEFGIIHALAEGTVTVTGITEYGISSTFVVYVTDPEFVARGDIDGNGTIEISDLVAVKSHILKNVLLTNNSLIAADMNKDAKVSVTDLITIKKHILGIV